MVCARILPKITENSSLIEVRLKLLVQVQDGGCGIRCGVDELRQTIITYNKVLSEKLLVENLRELQNKNTELESLPSLHPALVAPSLSPHLVDSAIKQNHKLHKYMKDNQILKAKAEEYKSFYLKYLKQINKNDDK